MVYTDPYYILYHDYTRGLKAPGQHRIGEVKCFGPFESPTVANIWAQHNLMNDENHEARVVDLNTLLR